LNPQKPTSNEENAPLRYFSADLHIHTCLSPCSDWEMSPKKIVAKSIDKQLDIIAICDHNSAENVQAAILLGEKAGLCVLAGMEICSREEVHILGLFSAVEQAQTMQEFVYANLPGENQAELFGYQVIVNEKDEVRGEVSRLLIGASRLSLQDIVVTIHKLGGLSIASHVDRPSFGIIGQLGFIPADLSLDGLEVSYRVPLNEAREKIPGVMNFPCISSSDAHFPDDIGKVKTVFTLAAPTFEEIRLALKGKHGRRIETQPGQAGIEY
jgi:PHP family Zn ribbon phosphoesterase